MKSNQTTQQLYIVATPIGNLADISRRAIEVLQQVDCILCENSEHSMRLLRHINVQPRALLKLTDHESPERIQYYLDKVGDGSMALISDAGTPLMCDPGHRLVEAAHARGFAVLPIPGPCAVTATLSICPFSVMPFQFLGFLPRKHGERLRLLEKVAVGSEALVFFESPRRLLNCLVDCEQVFGRNRQIFVVKELTKQFECYWHGTVDTVLQALGEGPIQGEFVVVLSGQEAMSGVTETIDLDQCLQALSAEGLSAQTIIKAIGPITTVRKNALYQRLQALKTDE